MRRALWLLPLVIMVAACNGGGGKPRSVGRAYEVTVVGRLPDSLAAALEQPVEGLPQAEPMFDVGRRPRLDADTRLGRAIVVGSKSRRLEMRHDVWARPQIVVLTDGSSPRRTAALLNAFERRQQVEALRRHHNPRAAETIRKMFGIGMLVPADMGSSMVRPGFVWLSNNAPQGMTNIAVMRGPADVALARHIKGRTDAMHMRLTAPLRPRGLWEMTGDAMGGPYVMRRVGEVTVIAFVYAPESKKRNLMRQLEAALYTIKQQHNGR